MNPSLSCLSWSSLKGQWDGNRKTFAVLRKNRPCSVFLNAGEALLLASGSLCVPVSCSSVHSDWLSCLEGLAGSVFRISEEPSPLPVTQPPTTLLSLSVFLVEHPVPWSSSEWCSSVSHVPGALDIHIRWTIIQPP